MSLFGETGQPPEPKSWISGADPDAGLPDEQDRRERGPDGGLSAVPGLN